MMKILAITILVLILFIVFLYVLYYMTFHNSPRRQKRHKYSPKMKNEHRPKLRALRDALRAAPCDRINITNREGKLLAGRYYHNRDNAPVAIIFHGYKGRALSDPAGGYKIFCDMGINVLLPDHRAHGESYGRTITFGIKERFDCLDWIGYLCERFNSPDILLVGVSMGAATVLMASGEALPDNVKCVIADCGYSSPEKIIRKVIAVDMKLPQRILFPFVRLAGRLYGGFDVCSYDAVRAVKETKLPILLIHGEADDFVPCQMANEIAQAGNCRLFTVPDATHGMSYIYDTEKYTETVLGFIKEIGI